jgi:hypothetical protein
MSPLLTSSHRYIPTLDVVLMTVSWPPRFPETSAPFNGKTGVANVRVAFEGVGWRPVVGQRLSA